MLPEKLRLIGQNIFRNLISIFGMYIQIIKTRVGRGKQKQHI